MPDIPLSPIDHIFTGAGAYPIEFVFAYDRAIDFTHLQESFHEVLHYFPPVHSKLVRSAEHTYSSSATSNE